MGEEEEYVRRLEERPPEVRRVHEAETLAKGIHGDDVAGTRLEYVMHLYDLAGLASLLHPCDHLCHVLFHDGLQSANAGDREERVERIAAAAMQIVVWR